MYMSGLICSDFCKEKGFSASGLPPRDSGQRICSCYDRNGQVTVTVDMEEIMTEKSD